MCRAVTRVALADLPCKVPSKIGRKRLIAPFPGVQTFRDTAITSDNTNLVYDVLLM